MFTLTFQKAIGAREDKNGGIIPELSDRRILIVEDIEINRIILQELLEETHVKIEEAQDGEAAVSVFSAKPPNYFDLIFMDVQMPVMGGYEATRKIRDMDRPDSKTVPIIAMTANAYKEDIEKAFASGMDGHLSKPIDLNAVMLALAEKLT